MIHAAPHLHHQIGRVSDQFLAQLDHRAAPGIQFSPPALLPAIVRQDPLSRGVVLDLDDVIVVFVAFPIARYATRTRRRNGA